MAHENRKLAVEAISGYQSAPLGHYIGGKNVPGEGSVHDVHEPATGDVIGQIRDASEAELNAAVVRW
jgi:5-carboxymethyl-2-hydroxymuconic-semialdehyde dehydrogenase